MCLASVVRFLGINTMWSLLNYLVVFNRRIIETLTFKKNTHKPNVQ